MDDDLKNREDTTVVSFPTIIDYCGSHAYAKRQNEKHRVFSKSRIFVNNGNAFNSKYIILKYTKKTLNVNKQNATKSKYSNNKNISETRKKTTLAENTMFASVIGLLSKKQYNVFLDQPTNGSKMKYLRQMCDKYFGFFEPHSRPLMRPKIKTNFKEHGNTGNAFEIMTVVRDRPSAKLQQHLDGCSMLDENDIATNLMLCGTIVFDITNDHVAEIEQARTAFDHLYDKLIRLNDTEIEHCMERGIVRVFILISSVAIWAKEDNEKSETVLGEDGETINNITPGNVLKQLPMAKYQALHELEKIIMKSNSSRVKAILKGYVLGTGLIYGHEENALRHVFGSAWNDPKKMYTLAENKIVPVFHVDDLAELVSVVSADHGKIRDRYILATEQQSYGFNTIVQAIRNHMCGSVLVPTNDQRSIVDQYKLTDLTYDLLCADLIIDPMLDVTVPGFQGRKSPIVADPKIVVEEFIQANGLHPFKVAVFGTPQHAVVNLAARIAQHYGVRLMAAGPSFVNYLNAIKEQDQEALTSRMNEVCENRLNFISASAKASGMPENEWLDRIYGTHVSQPSEINGAEGGEIGQMTADENSKSYSRFSSNYLTEPEGSAAMSENSAILANLEYSMYVRTLSDGPKNIVFDFDDQIESIKVEMRDLNEKYADYEANMNDNGGQLKDHYLIPLLRKSLASFACRHRGYVLGGLPFNVDQAKTIFNDTRVGHPDVVVILSGGKNAKAMQKNDKDDDDGAYLRCDDDSVEYNSNDDDDQTGNSEQFNRRPGKGKTGRDANKKLNGPGDRKSHSLDDLSRAKEYFSGNGVRVIELNVPPELLNDKSPNNLYYKPYVRTIVAKVGNPYKGDIALEDELAKKTNRTSAADDMEQKQLAERVKIESAFEKMEAMKKQWCRDIVNTLQIDRKEDTNDLTKLHNRLVTDILPNLLKEIRVNDLVEMNLSTVEKTLNKNKLCETLNDEGIEYGKWQTSSKYGLQFMKKS